MLQARGTVVEALMIPSWERPRWPRSAIFQSGGPVGDLTFSQPPSVLAGVIRLCDHGLSSRELYGRCSPVRVSGRRGG